MSKNNRLSVHVQPAGLAIRNTNSTLSTEILTPNLQFLQMSNRERKKETAKESFTRACVIDKREQL